MCGSDGCVDQMDVWIRWMCAFTEKERKNKKRVNSAIVGLEPVSLVMNNGTVRWSGHAQCKDDADWI